MTQKIDPSVTNGDLEKRLAQGEQIGTVPLSRTMRKPEAYKPRQNISAQKDNNP